MSDLENKVESILKELQEIKANQKEITEKMIKMQEIVNHIEDDIYMDEGFDFEITCPYCENEFIADLDEDKEIIKCPKCENIIELDWDGCCDDECDCGCGCSSDCDCGCQDGEECTCDGECECNCENDDEDDIL